MANKDDSIDGTIETLAKGLTKKGSEVKGRQREHVTDVGGAGEFATDSHGNAIDDDYDDGGAASEYKVGGVRFKRGFVHFLYLLGVNVTRYSSISSFVSWLIHYVI